MTSSVLGTPVSSVVNRRGNLRLESESVARCVACHHHRRGSLVAALKGKVAVVTGATSGIGARTAERLVSDGAQVVISGRRESAGRALESALGRAASFRRADVTIEADVEALVAFAMERHGRLDVMVNNAGTPSNLTAFANTDLEVFARTLAVHLLGVLSGVKHAARHMLSQGSGSIINMASTSGLIAGWTGHDYATAKAAVIQLTKAAAAELGEHNIRVNAISPGLIMTGILGKQAGITQDQADTDGPSRIEQVFSAFMHDHQPIHRPGTTDDVAAAVAWLASDDAGLVNGHNLVIDGGLTTGRPYSVTVEERRRLAAILADGTPASS